MRWIKCILCFTGALLLLFAAWLVPAYLRAIDAEVVKLRGRDSATLVDRGLELLELEQIGPATMLAATASKAGLARVDLLNTRLGQYAAAHPELAQRGGADPFVEQLLVREAGLDLRGATNALLVFLPQQSRTTLRRFLGGSRRPGVQQILKNRELRNTVHLPAVNSAAGQPLEAAILMAALLHQEDQLSSRLREDVESAAVAANLGTGSQAIELFYLDLLSLARRLDWVQLRALVARLDGLDDVEQVVTLSQRAGDRLPVLYAALIFAESPRTVLDYLTELGVGSLDDLEFAMSQGAGALEAVLARAVEVQHAPARGVLAARAPVDAVFFGFLELTARIPSAGLYFKYLFVLLGGFLLVGGITLLLPRPTELEMALQLRQFGRARQSVVAVCLFLVIMAASEPHLVDTHQPDAPLPRWKFPMADANLVAQIAQPLDKFMNQLTIASLIGFLVIQAIIYIICLLRVAEIRKQHISADLKLKLLDNEENMFDAGLYVGLGGTVTSLVFLALGIVKPSLMAAYASTLFGIIFVALLKICHVRPFRRRLILETEFKG